MASMQEPDSSEGCGLRAETQKLTSAATREDEASAVRAALLLRGVDLAGSVGLLVDDAGRVLAASDEFIARYGQGRGHETPPTLASLGLDAPLAERMGLAVREAVASGPVDGLGGRAVSIEGAASGPSIVLLVAMPARAGVGVPSAVGVGPSGGSTARVLLVEDDEQVRAQALRSLAGADFEVRAVASAKAALELVESGEPFDVLVTDVVMPEMSGPELAEELAGWQPHLGVLFVSGYADGRLVDPGTPDAPRAFLAKPHTSAALRVAVAGLWTELRDGRSGVSSPPSREG